MINATYMLFNICLALVLVEIGLRVIPVQEPEEILIKDTSVAASSDLLNEIFNKYVPVDNDIDRKWFFTTPAEYLEKIEIENDFSDLGKDVSVEQIYSILGSNFPKVYNYNFIKKDVCENSGQYFLQYPFDLYSFKVPTNSEYPRYRFFPNAQHSSGLVTNRYGYRGQNISIHKPQGTIRLAFLGASTTLNHPRMVASYPEFIGMWLNKWAKKSGLNYKFEIINAGRDSAISTEMPSLLTTEILPFQPDIVVFYGSNQFNFRGLVELPNGEEFGRPFHERLKTLASDYDGFGGSSYLYKALVGAFYNIKENVTTHSILKEPKKPDYNIIWPKDVKEHSPDPDSPNLPLSLPIVISDLKKINEISISNEAIFVLSSFVWLAQDKMEIDQRLVQLDPLRGGTFNGLYGYLNEKMWPVKYKDIRRFADFQNRVFKNYSLKYGVEYIDLGGNIFPQDYRLFFDAAHMSEAGIRLRAWLSFLQLKEIIRKNISIGKMPNKTIAPSPPESWPTAIDIYDIDCQPEGFEKLKSYPLDINLFEREYRKANLKFSSSGVLIKTGSETNSYAGRINLPPIKKEGAWLRIKAKVESGRVSFGVLNKKKTKFLVSKLSVVI